MKEQVMSLVFLAVFGVEPDEVYGGGGTWCAVSSDYTNYIVSVNQEWYRGVVTELSDGLTMVVEEEFSPYDL
jgi:hypothetical protein